MKVIENNFCNNIIYEEASAGNYKLRWFTWLASPKTQTFCKWKQQLELLYNT